MREIKFRGKQLYAGAWVYGDYLKHTGYHYISSEWGELNEVIPVTVSQYIGLKDKKGVEIYEGDFLGGLIGGTVVWLEKEARFGIDILGETNETRFDEWKQEDLEVVK